VLVIQQKESIPEGSTFMTSVRIFPANNPTRVNPAVVDQYPDWTQAPLPFTGVVWWNCMGADGFKGGNWSVFSAPELTWDRDRYMQPRKYYGGNTLNPTVAGFGFKFPNIAWLGYDSNILYITTLRCEFGSAASCYQCQVWALAANFKGPPDGQLVGWTNATPLNRRRMAAVETKPRGVEVAIKMHNNPVTLQDTPFEDRAKVDLSSTVMLAFLSGLLSMLL